MDTIAFLDLEETLIDDWATFLPVNVDIVRQWIDTLPKGTRFGLFSWAVWDDKDVLKFKRLAPELTDYFGIVFENDIIFNTAQMREIIREQMKWQALTEEDFSDLFNKERAFHEFAKAKRFNGKKLFLLDDTVPNLVTINKDTGTEIELVNVKTLGKRK